MLLCNKANINVTSAMKQILVLRVQWSNISGTSAIKQILVLRVQLSNKCTNYLNLLLAKCYGPELIVARETIDSITDCFIFGEKVGLQVRTKIRQVRYWLYCHNVKNFNLSLEY